MKVQQIYILSVHLQSLQIVFVHELGHLCGLSDLVNSEKNLMYEANESGKQLGNIPLKAKLSDEDKYGSGWERQWDCLHDEKKCRRMS